MSLLLLFGGEAAPAGNNGTLTQTLGALTLSATGTVDVQGVASVTLGALALSATGTVDVQGTLSKTLGSLSLSAAGTVDMRGSASITLGALTLSSAGTVAVQGQLSATLGSLSLVATAGAVSANLGELTATLGTLTVSASGVVNRPSTTTAAAIRDYVAQTIAALTPAASTQPRFRRVRDAEIRAWAEANPTAALRRFQVRAMRTDEAPDVSNVYHQTHAVDLEIVVAYPHTMRHGADGALDRDDAIRLEHEQIETAIGRRAWLDYINTDHDATWTSGTMTREIGRGVDFLVIRQTMRFRRGQG